MKKIFYIFLIIGLWTGSASATLSQAEIDSDALMVAEQEIKGQAMGTVISELRNGTLCENGGEYYDYCNPYSGEADAQNTPSEASTITPLPPARSTNTTTPTNNAVIGSKSVKLGNNIIGGPCYSSNIGSLTTGQYEKISPAFEKAVQNIFQKEGACANVGDGKGMTCFGITSADNREFFQNGFWKLSERQKRARAEDWYYKYYWVKPGIDKLPDSVSGDVFAMYMHGKYNYFAIAMMVLDQGRLPVSMNDYRDIPENYKQYVRNAYVPDSIVAKVKASNQNLHKLLMDAYSTMLIERCRPNPPKKPSCGNKCGKLRPEYKPQTVYCARFQNGWQNAAKLIRENGCHVRSN